MNSRLLIFLETLERSNSISEAAQKLYLTQPYLSRIIKKYEDQYNVELINRHSHPIKLTPAGQLLIKYLRKSLQLHNQLHQEMKKYENNHFSTLKMGITPPLGEKFNVTVLPPLLAKFPNLATETLELSTADAEKAFKDGQLDLFVGNPIHLPHVENKILYTSHQVLVLSQESHLFQADKLEIKPSKKKLPLLNHENFIVVDGERRYQEIVNSYFNNIGINFYPRIHVRDSQTALQLACLGLGNMTTGIEAIQRIPHPKINFIKLPPSEININFSVSTAKTKNHLSFEIDYVISILQQEFKKALLQH